MYKKRFLTQIIIALVYMAISGCTALAAPADMKSVQSTAVSGQHAKEEILCTVKAISLFGDAVLDISSEEFLNRGFACGDAVELQFADKKLSNIPFYNNFYGANGDSILTCFNEDLYISCIVSSFQKSSGIKVGDRVTITLAEKGKYNENMQLYYLQNPKVMYDWQTDDNYANTWMIEVGEIKPSRIYRGSSPFDPEYGRVLIVSDYIDKNNIQTIIDLADDAKQIASYGGLTQEAYSILKRDKVKFGKMGVDYSSEETHMIMGKILGYIADYEAPFLVHCSIGQDRTGFVCCALEAFCGASYNEIVADYMKSYENLYGLTKTSNPDKYKLMKKRIDFMLSVVTGNEHPAAMSAPEIKKAAWDYFRKAGLSDEKIQQAFDNIAGFSQNEANIPDVTVRGTHNVGNN